MKKTGFSKNRRNILKLGLFTGGAALAGAGISTAFVKGASGNNEEKVKVLTMDGKLVEVDKESINPNSLQVATNAEARKGIEGKRFVMVIDLSRCDGCGKCTEACQKMHFIPPEREWIKVFKMKDNEATAPYWFPKPCFHCDNPPCTKVCPVDATFKRDDGIVLIDNERCIGCRFCMAACPYSARFFNWGEPKQPAEVAAMPYSPEQSYPAKIGTVEKCDFCPHVVRKGVLPACVSGCPMDAIYYGDEYEDAITNHSGATVSFRKLVDDNAGYVYLEDLGTKPRVFYLPPKNRMYPKPKIKKEEGHDNVG
ncbi:Sulfite reduction-associated complex DsrMKJOP iron-sulfur protein DsrO (=HmeA) [hydrothermal vent metagenome]|uniref:Sulfite reduction-associated complex DsrMKJOP iron-sulfur protein DsrO (=HmeA) n=1 Tax=hydrothermal vent metagenome TaxID=652676 RepID=A0A3B0UCA9_9ZZZZ